MSKFNKEPVIQAFKRHDKDTGSPEVQIALLSARINSLKPHFEKNKKDFHSRKGLIHMTNSRRKLLRGLKKTSMERYEAVVKAYNL